ncbi:hypothetical protein OCU04_004521 [Sclerotinia nivalis]|uniref:Protein-ribulosamine 3-kinase n=1 Tax=Sclerotinia nivalis TaxID=352851 RepID=A0A9X0AQL4_9HELO|nr:hypothetical protein OCU04_004521 [Sclerotinia nivalis]
MTDSLISSKASGNFELDQAVIAALPVPGTKVLAVYACGVFVWARPALLVCQLPDGKSINYFLKVTTGESDRLMSQGQYESDAAIYAVSPNFMARRLNSQTYGPSDIKKHGHWPEFEYLSTLVLDKCILRLLRPLQSEGRTIKPCLVHGNIWDGNTATDMESGEPFVYDGSAFYAHNEYELGNWRSPRHRLSSRMYIRSYKRNFPASEPEEDWDLRNLLYSLRFNVTAGVLIPGSNYRELVLEDLRQLCKAICPDDVAAWKRISMAGDAKCSVNENDADIEGEEEDEGEEEEEEEEEETESD